MKDYMEKIRRNLQHWMIGRYGTDELSVFLFSIGIVILLISAFVDVRFLSIPAWIILIYGYYRCFSKNISARSKERDFYIRTVSPVKRKFQLYQRIWRDRKTHRYFKCPNCKKMIRVPKGKGKIEISCTNCRSKMIKTT